MLSQAKALIAKSWKNEDAELPVGKHEVNETLIVRVRGQIEKHDDQQIAPTISIPLIPVLAFFWEKTGIERDAALVMLREAITEAMQDGVKEDHAVQGRIADVDRAIKSIRTELLNRLPKMHRSGRLDTKNLCIDVLALSGEEEPLTAEAA
jgi:hypothetical protein